MTEKELRGIETSIEQQGSFEKEKIMKLIITKLSDSEEQEKTRFIDKLTGKMGEILAFLRMKRQRDSTPSPSEIEKKSPV
ncbi:MAG: hypothetical protein HYS60_01585 [Candidatus Wildermuthbacteria bacterium]|nr:hypothetical protein [Candidatus Wildermuthbacteria bacterium]